MEGRRARCLYPCISAVRRRVFRIGGECWWEGVESNCETAPVPVRASGGRGGGGRSAARGPVQRTPVSDCALVGQDQRNGSPHPVLQRLCCQAAKTVRATRAQTLAAKEISHAYPAAVLRTGACATPPKIARKVADTSPATTTQSRALPKTLPLLVKAQTSRNVSLHPHILAIVRPPHQPEILQST